MVVEARQGTKKFLKQTSLRRTRKLSVIWWRWICDAILATRSTSRILKDLFFFFFSG